MFDLSTPWINYRARTLSIFITFSACEKLMGLSISLVFRPFIQVWRSICTSESLWFKVGCSRTAQTCWSSFSSFQYLLIHAVWHYSLDIIQIGYNFTYHERLLRGGILGQGCLTQVLTRPGRSSLGYAAWMLMGSVCCAWMVRQERSPTTPNCLLMNFPSILQARQLCNSCV